MVGAVALSHIACTGGLHVRRGTRYHNGDESVEIKMVGRVTR